MTGGLVQCISLMNSSVRELMEMIDAAPAEQLAEASGHVQQLTNLTAALASRLALAVDRSGVYADDGFRSAGRWIAFHTAERASQCNRRVRQARQLLEMPATRDAAERGLLTADQLRLLCDAQAAAPDRYDEMTDTSFVALATSGGTHELGRAVRVWKERAEAERSPDPADLPPVDAEQELRLFPTFDGWWNGTVHLSPNDGLMLNTLIDGEVDGYLRAARDGDPSLAGLSMGALRAKALVDLVARAARRAPGEVSAPDRYRVGITFPFDTDPALVPDAACDADLYRIVLGADGEPLDIGRTTKRWTTAIRRAVTVRDGHCTFPGCDRPPSHCDIHHCRPWGEGGETASTNGTLLCRHHHTFVHERRWQVHLDHRQQPVFIKPDGTPHQPTSRRPRVPCG